ncbi:MAG: sugar phosphate nucleotidyltransferase, partial [Polyangiaceae bacterium]
MTAAIVLSAGLGTRLGALTKELAKPLMPVGDRPALAHIVERLVAARIDRVAINTHHRAADFASVRDRLGCDVEVLHEPNILGTAGGVANAAGALGEGDAVVWNGDIIAPDLDVAAVLAAFGSGLASGAGAIWVVAPLPIGAGTVGLDENGHVVRLRGETFGEERSGGDFLGIQVMGADLRRALPREGCLVGDVALPLLRRGGRIATFAFSGAWDDIGSPASLLSANLRWLTRSGRTSWSAPDAAIGDGVVLERAIVGAGARVAGAGAVRECVVFPGATLTAPATRKLVATQTQMDVDRTP